MHKVFVASSRSPRTIDPTGSEFDPAHLAHLARAFEGHRRGQPIVLGQPPNPLTIAFTTIDAHGGAASVETLVRAGLSLLECVKLQESGGFDTRRDEHGTIIFSRRRDKLRTDILGIIRQYGPEADVPTLLAAGLSEKQISCMEELGLIRVLRTYAQVKVGGRFGKELFI